MGTGFDYYFGIGSILVGLYCIYAVYSMKTTGKICTIILLDKETAAKPCKNTGEYIMSVIPAVMILGVVLIIYGIITLLAIYYEQLFAISMCMLVITLLALIWFGVVTTKAKKKYFD